MHTSWHCHLLGETEEGAGWESSGRPPGGQTRALPHPQAPLHQRLHHLHVRVQARGVQHLPGHAYPQPRTRQASKAGRASTCACHWDPTAPLWGFSINSIVPPNLNQTFRLNWRVVLYRARVCARLQLLWQSLWLPLQASACPKLSWAAFPGSVKIHQWVIFTPHKWSRALSKCHGPRYTATVNSSGAVIWHCVINISP